MRKSLVVILLAVVGFMFAAGPIHNPTIINPALVVAASNASASARASADYVCDGTADNVQIQAAIDAATATGGTVQLSEGTFNIAATVSVADAVHLCGRGHYATILYAVEGLNADVLKHDVVTATGGFRLSNLQINGRKWKAYYGTALFTSYLVAAHRITGAGVANTEAGTGRLHLSIVKVDATPTWRINFYSDSGRTALVAHTDNFTAAGLVAVNADGASGLGGYIGARTAVEDATYWKARADLSLRGNYAGDGFSATNKMIDAYFDNFVIRDCAERGMDLATGWGNIISTGWLEWMGSDGIRVTGGTALKVSNLKVIAVDGHAISLDGCQLSTLTNCELMGGDFELVGAADAVALWSTGKAGLYLSGANGTKVVNTRFSIPASCYGILAGDATLTSNVNVAVCAFGAAHATLTTAVVGISIPARDDVAGSGTYWSVVGNNFASITTGFQVNLAGGREGTNGGHALTGNIFRSCTTGAILGSRANVVTGGQVVSCTTGMSLTEQRNVLRGIVFISGTTQVSVGATGGYANIEGCSFNTGTTCILLASGAYDNVVRNNTFASGVSVSMAGATATIEYNVGAGAIVSGSGALVSGKCTTVESGSDIVHKTVLTLTLTGANTLNVAAGANYGGGVKIYDFPAGRIAVLGVVINGSCTATGLNADPNDTYELGLGTTAKSAADAALATTEIDFAPAAAFTQAAASNWRTELAATAQFDGTSTAVDLYVNAHLVAASKADANTFSITGTVTIYWINLGDY